MRGVTVISQLSTVNCQLSIKRSAHFANFYNFK